MTMIVHKPAHLFVRFRCGHAAQAHARDVLELLAAARQGPCPACREENEREAVCRRNRVCIDCGRPLLNVGGYEDTGLCRACVDAEVSAHED